MYDISSYGEMGKGFAVVISVRVAPEQEQKYREYAKSQGLTVSEFMRRCADDVIAQAEDLLRKAEEDRKHAEEVADFMRRFNAYLDDIHRMPIRQLTDEEIDALRLARYA